MAKNFRLFQDKDVNHWDDRNTPIGTTQINNILNPQGFKTTKEPTSIPSPFSRFDLVRTAFAYVSENGLEGNTVYHKIVSDTLDVATLFFLAESIPHIQIKYWDKNVDLPELLNSNNPAHVHYGKTIDLFLKQDGKVFNFDKMDRLYFIYFKNKIVGGTSPTTLFFPSANNLNFAQIQVGQDILFDEKYTSLVNRELDFQKYLFLLFQAGNFHPFMKEMGNYLEKCKQFHHTQNFGFHQELAQLNISDLHNNYELLTTGIAGNFVSIFNQQLFKKKQINALLSVQNHSEFIIKSNKYQGTLPLALQNKFSMPLAYTDKNITWNPNTIVNNFDPNPLDQRVLPDSIVKYPYLTIDDFLETSLVKVNYHTHKNKYFDGNLIYETGSEQKFNYLLPLKPLFFKFFDTNDLTETLANGKPMIQIYAYPNSVTVLLNIPIQNGKTVCFRKDYFENSQTNAQGVGSITDVEFTTVIYPFIKQNNHYRVLQLENDRNSAKNLDFNFYTNDGNSISVKHTVNRTKLDNLYLKVHVLESNFDYISIQKGGVQNILIPKLQAPSNSQDSFTFAIDFGTSNTHIEYNVNNGPSKTFEITENDIQMGSYIDLNQVGSSLTLNSYKDIIQKTFMFEQMNSNFYGFPKRTAIQESSTIDFSQINYALADFNIPFYYESEPKPRNERIITNLKWSAFYHPNSPESNRFDKFVEQIMLMLRHKVMLNQGRLEQTKLIWFYPSSMTPNAIDQIENTWAKYYQLYFGQINSSNLIKVSESLAPFYYYYKKESVIAHDRPVVSIDIGGGTTDYVVFKSNTPTFFGSFRFAANNLFGDGYHGNPNNNGFVIKGNASILSQLPGNLKKVYSEIAEMEKSEDFVSFFLSLEQNKELMKNNLHLSFQKEISSDTKIKYSILYFASAIIYHIAKAMKEKNTALPRFVLFSGNGAKILKLLDGSLQMDKIKQLVNLIFSKVFEKSENIDVKLDSNPKQLTALGGLYLPSQVPTPSEFVYTINNAIEYYEDVDAKKAEYFPMEIQELQNFTNLFFELNREMNFQNVLGLNAAVLPDLKNFIQEFISSGDAKAYLEEGWLQKKEALNGNLATKLDEPFFFYAIRELIYRMAFYLGR